tara:strand:+ start:190 stop:333 length:144 start_codon:yes stop_codon:yes gene_type:complete
MNSNQLEYVRLLDYISRGELSDLLRGFTDIEVLLDAEDLEEYNRKGK